MKPDFAFVNTNGVRLRVAQAGTGPLIVLVHGWPESWYSWRHQIAALAAAGYRVAAVDVRGYGGSDKPESIDAYSIKEMCTDIAGLIDSENPGFVCAPRHFADYGNRIRSRRADGAGKNIICLGSLLRDRFA